MPRIRLSALTAGLVLFSVSVWAQNNPCDVNGDGLVDAKDVQAIISMSGGSQPCTANIAGPGVCNVDVVQRVINAAMGSVCFTSPGIHQVGLTWIASISPNIVGYQVYRSTVSGGSYSLIATLGNVITYTDNTVQSGLTYFYVVTAVENNNNVSPYSNMATAIIPVP